ncbi:hybrid sensor histidine kinase/response regulator [Calothrix sp. PCC 6303]|uniref:hybrid sensor histidine kinase/response regulator n=1 Tax=Calothrix sp. PCC 6303 TaxID=1170562 RepID=UPI0002A02634|nr:hybrid sensor histidine kinase/response regulator [Calothrix sp. PCC 6303]AFZ03018.1 CheA signal transduction histidine kinase [Calothrix sp. PCC 6303]
MFNQIDLEIQLQFIEETKQHLITIENILLGIRENQKIDIQEINIILRAAHSIKGGAAMINMDILSDLAHILEDNFKTLKTSKSQLKVDANIQNLFLNIVDRFRQIINLPIDSIDVEIPATQCYEMFNELHEILGDSELEDASTILATEDNSQDIIVLIFQTQVEECLQKVEVLLQEQPHNLRDELSTISSQLGGLGHMFDLANFLQLCESFTNQLKQSDSEDEVLKIGNLALESWRLSQVLVLKNKLDLLPTSLDNHGSIYPTPESPKVIDIPIFTPAKVEPTENTIRVPFTQLEEINNYSSELVVKRQQLSLKLEQLRHLAHYLNKQASDLERQQYEAKIATQNPLLHAFTVKIQEIATDIETHLEDTGRINYSLNKNTQQLQESLSKVLMRPLSEILERFPRVLYNLCNEHNKKAELKIVGADIRLERNILEALQEPLLHLLRNAFDHGIETPEQRHASGKSDTGIIEISATHQQNRTVITVSDDGRGVNLDKVRQRALNMGLDASLLEQASEKDILDLIFEPGFSTREEVSNLSGRGVGMDVVRSKVKEIGGEVILDTVEGMGTSFTLSVPLSLSVLRVLLLESDRMLVAVPSEAVAAIFLSPEERIVTIGEREYLSHQDEMLPLIRLNRYWQFNCPRYHQKNPKRKKSTSQVVVVIQQNHQVSALQVEHCCGEQQVEIRAIEGNLPLPIELSNCTILDDGRLVPMVNLDEILSREHQKVTTKQPPSLGARKSKPTVLLVDDSINIRRYLASTLEKAGYFVEQAEDGLDAWEKLQAGLIVNGIVCDVDMPRLDGYGLLAYLKSDSQLKRIPVTMLTSQTSDRYQKLAFQLGAKAYLFKPYNEYDLLNKLSEVISFS